MTVSYSIIRIILIINYSSPDTCPRGPRIIMGTSSAHVRATINRWTPSISSVSMVISR